MTRVEPKYEEMVEWATGLRDCYRPTAYEWINWAYWYLGYDDPEFKACETVINEAICKLTEACRLRLKELGYGV